MTKRGEKLLEHRQRWLAAKERQTRRQRTRRRTLRILKIACMTVGTCLLGMYLRFMKSFIAIFCFLGSLWAWTIAAWANWRMFPNGRETYKKRIGYAGLYRMVSYRTSSIFLVLLGIASFTTLAFAIGALSLLL